MPVDWCVQALHRDHDRAAFRCGEPPLDEYLAKYARQNHESGVARTFIAVRAAEPTVILGYYSLAAGSIPRAHLPELEVRRLRFPNFPLPVARLARLAVDLSQQSKGIGAGLLYDALSRCSRAADDYLGIAALIIDAKDEKAKAFYSRYEFVALPDQPLTLWLPLSTLRKLLA